MDHRLRFGGFCCWWYSNHWIYVQISCWVTWASDAEWVNPCRYKSFCMQHIKNVPLVSTMYTTCASYHGVQKYFVESLNKQTSLNLNYQFWIPILISGHCLFSHFNFPQHLIIQSLCLESVVQVVCSLKLIMNWLPNSFLGFLKRHTVYLKIHFLACFIGT